MTHEVAPYLVLKLAREFFGKAPHALEEAERQRVLEVARRQSEIERRILATLEASSVVLPESSVDQAFGEIRARFADAAEFDAGLAQAGLTPERLREAIARDLQVEAALEQVGRRAAPVSDTDAEIFYLQNLAKFHKPETRTLRHILVTINEALPGSARTLAREKIGSIQARLAKAPERFAEQALKHSECPTAMNGGLLGSVGAGTLYAELDAVAFALPQGGLSGIVESPLGFHVLLCEAIDPARRVPYAEAQERIRGHLAGKRRESAQKKWIAGLFQPA